MRKEKRRERNCSADMRLNHRCKPDLECLQPLPSTFSSPNLIYNPNLDSGLWKVKRDGMCVQMKMQATVFYSETAATRIAMRINHIKLPGNRKAV